MHYRAEMNASYLGIKKLKVKIIHKLEVHGRARPDAARRRNTEWTVNLAIRNCSPNNATCQMTPKTVL